MREVNDHNFSKTARELEEMQINIRFKETIHSNFTNKKFMDLDYAPPNARMACTLELRLAERKL